MWEMKTNKIEIEIEIEINGYVIAVRKMNSQGTR